MRVTWEVHKNIWTNFDVWPPDPLWSTLHGKSRIFSIEPETTSMAEGGGEGGGGGGVEL